MVQIKKLSPFPGDLENTLNDIKVGVKVERVNHGRGEVSGMVYVAELGDELVPAHNIRKWAPTMRNPFRFFNEEVPEQRMELNRYDAYYPLGFPITSSAGLGYLVRKVNESLAQRHDMQVEPAILAEALNPIVQQYLQWKNERST